MEENLSKYLKLIRIKTGDSLRTMASKLNISPAYLSSIENGKRNIPANFENLVFSAYNLTAAEKEKIIDAIYCSLENYRVDLSNIGARERNLLLSIAKNELPDSTIDKLCAIIKNEENVGEREDE